jgi:20S proteasome subunit beta 4
METVLGFTGKDFVLVACESSTVRSIMRLKEGDDKLLHVGKQAIMGISGEAADRVAFGEYIQRNMAFYALKSGVTLSTHAVANFTR